MENECISRDTFLEACSRFPTGVTVTTLLGKDGAPHGITLSSFISVSLAPPLILVCIDHRSRLVRHLQLREPFAINVLNSEQRQLSIQFAGNWEDRFKGVQWSPGVTGVPLLDGALAVFECRTNSVIPAGDHLIVLGEVVRAASNTKWPLAYANRTYGTLVFSEKAS